MLKRKVISIFLAVFFLSLVGVGQEICDNGIDDDADGLVDLQDVQDCSCGLIAYDSTITSLIPNPSFESRNCCPTMLSQMSCANTWIQASPATSDYFNTCGIQRIPGFGFSFPPTPIPSGDGYVGFYNNGGGTGPTYKEYVGSCLLDTLRIGINYQIEFYLAQSRGSLTTPIAIFGTTSCANLPFGSTTPTLNACPTIAGAPNWTLLDADTVTCSSSAWTVVRLNFTPTQNYTAIVIGGTCGTLIGSNYYFADSLVLNRTSNFTVPIATISDSGHYCQGNLVLKANFDSLPNSFQWYKDSIAIVGATDSSYVVAGNGLGNYQVKLQYNSGCYLTDVYELDTTIITFDLDSLGTCPLGPQTGLISIVNAQAGTAPYTYSLNSGSFITDTFFDQLSAGTYSITVRDSNLCEASSSITVEPYPMPVASFLADTLCLGQPTSFISTSTIDSGTITQWLWSIPGVSATPSMSYSFPTDGVQSITHSVISDLGCVDDTTINVIVRPLPEVDFTFSPSEIFTFSPDVCFSNLTTGAIGYAWDFDFVGTNGTSTATSPCTVTFPDDQERTYQVALVAQTNFGCIDSLVRNITVSDEFLVYIPNAFSPNDDGLNDEFVITAAGVQSLSFQLFNRWGELVFNSTETNITWDGTQNGTPVQQGVYVYRATVRGQNGVVKELFGHVNLVK